jgi:hypothetical protein
MCPRVFAANVDFREKTLGNRLEDWGFTLNPEIRRLLKEDLRKQVADLLRVNCKSSIPLRFNIEWILRAYAYSLELNLYCGFVIF